MNTLTSIENYPSFPVPFMMRENVDLWFRIHSLPDSKRYPETEAEWEILLSRHKEISNAVLIPGAKCRLTYAQFSGFDFPSSKLPELKWNSYQRVGEGEDFLDTWVSNETIWDFSTFIEWVQKRSNDELGMIGFHSLESDSLYFPYDGGADIFSLNKSLLAEIRSRFAGWKSPLESGL